MIALRAALLGNEVLTKDYESVRIRIAFHPQEEKFEVANPAIRKDRAWVPDVSEIFSPEASFLDAVDAYCDVNKGTERKTIARVLEKLRGIVYNHVGVIDLAEDLDIETVTEIFIRVNSAGVALSQADFAMSKIATNSVYGGTELRKAIDYFCYLAKQPEQFAQIERHDPSFASTEIFSRMRWLKDVVDDLYDPTYSDMLRVAFASEFARGRLQDLVALLSGRNFETKQYEEDVAERSFAGLRRGVLQFVNQTHFERFTMILRSGGFITSDLIGGQMPVNFAYIIYLNGRKTGISAADLERIVRRWYAMTILRGRYAGSPETAIDVDIRQITETGLLQYCNATVDAELSSSFWETLLPQQMDTSSASSPYFRAYQAAQVKAGEKGFLSRDITVRDLLLNRSDVHHVFPKDHLKGRGLARNKYNQIANFVLCQSEINIAIGNKSPTEYFAGLKAQCSGSIPRYGGITDISDLRSNLTQHCIPTIMLDEEMSYDDFLLKRRRLMALKIRDWFSSL